MSFKSDIKFLLSQKWDYTDYMIWGGVTVMILWIVVKLSGII